MQTPQLVKTRVIGNYLRGKNNKVRLRYFHRITESFL